MSKVNLTEIFEVRDCFRITANGDIDAVAEQVSRYWADFRKKPYIEAQTHRFDKEPEARCIIYGMISEIKIQRIGDAWGSPAFLIEQLSTDKVTFRTFREYLEKRSK